MSPLAMHPLGRPRLERDGQPIHVGRTKAVALLAYLAVTGLPHTRQGLVTRLSPELEQSRARAEFRKTVSVLNSSLGCGFRAGASQADGSFTVEQI